MVGVCESENFLIGSSEANRFPDKLEGYKQMAPANAVLSDLVLFELLLYILGKHAEMCSPQAARYRTQTVECFRPRIAICSIDSNAHLDGSNETLGPRIADHLRKVVSSRGSRLIGEGGQNRTRSF